MWYGSELLLNMVAQQPFFQDCISSQVSHNQAKSKKKKNWKKKTTIQQALTGCPIHYT